METLLTAVTTANVNYEKMSGGLLALGAVLGRRSMTADAKGNWLVEDLEVGARRVWQSQIGPQFNFAPADPRVTEISLQRIRVCSPDKLFFNYMYWLLDLDNSE